MCEQWSAATWFGMVEDRETVLIGLTTPTAIGIASLTSMMS
jgi:hypothetical protein